MGIKKTVSVACDQCQKDCTSNCLRISDGSYTASRAHFAMPDLGDLFFCSWECIRKWGIKDAD